MTGNQTHNKAHYSTLNCQAISLNVQQGWSLGSFKETKSDIWTDLAQLGGLEFVMFFEPFFKLQPELAHGRLYRDVHGWPKDAYFVLVIEIAHHRTFKKVTFYGCLLL